MTICDNCSNYQPCLSGVDEYYYTACKAWIDKELKKLYLNGEMTKCSEFKKI